MYTLYYTVFTNYWKVYNNIGSHARSMLHCKKFSIIIFLAVLFFFPAISSVSASDPAWPMFKGNPQHTGQSHFNGSDENTLRWNFPAGMRITSSPAVGSDGTIYFGSHDTNLYAINPDGSLRCSFKAGEFIDSSPAIAPDGMIYFGSWDKKLYKIDADCNRIWSAETAGRIASSPTIGPNGTVYFGSDDDFLRALDSEGNLKWSFRTGERIVSIPAVAPDGTVFVGSFDNSTYAINPDGEEKWRFKTGGFVFSSPSISPGGTVYFGSYDGNLYAINPDGTEKWRFFTGDVVQASPAIALDSTIYVGSFNGNLYAINPDGTEKWRFKTGDLVVSSPAIDSDGTIYFGSVDMNLYAINPDGTEKWRFETNARIFSSPAIAADGTIYVGSVDNNLYAIGKQLTPSDSALPVNGFVNELVGYGGTELYVVEVMTGTSGTNRTIDLHVVLKNHGTQPRIFDPSSFRLKDLSGNEYIPDVMKSGLKKVKIQAGDIARGTLMFEMSNEAVADLLMYQDFRGIRLTVNLTAPKLPPDNEPVGILEPGSNVGKKLIGDNIEITILDEKFLESDPQQYLITISIKNLSETAVRYDQTYAYVKDAMGNVYTPGTQGAFNGELDPNESVTGEIMFIVPSSVSSVIFVYDDETTSSYFVVPEFPLSIIVTALSVSLMIFLRFLTRGPSTPLRRFVRPSHS
jgi:outer membrane protein assembly factor BamB